MEWLGHLPGMRKVVGSDRVMCCFRCLYALSRPGLKKEGILTEEEFREQKAKLLART